MNTAARSPLKTVLMILGGLFALLVAVIIGFVFLLRSATSGPEEAAQGFLAAAAKGDYDRAHGYFSAPLKEAQPLADFRAGAEANPSLFDVAETTFNERSIDMNGAKMAGTLTLRSGTEVAASFSFVEENDEWKLIAYQIGSGD